MSDLTPVPAIPIEVVPSADHALLGPSQPNGQMDGWVPIDSTCLDAFRVVRATPSALVLQVRFRDSQRVYEYLGVDHPTLADLLTAPSAGRYYNTHIKGHFRSRPVGWYG